MMVQMRRWLSIGLINFSLVVAALDEAPLKRYAGNWKVSRKSAAGQSEQLQNQCAQAGKSYVCEQTVAGSVRGLLVFLPTNTPGHFTTQNILPDGRATGKGDLTIDRNRWTFTSTWNGGATVTHYRTTNVFLTTNQVHFEQEESTDGTHWQLKDSGEETRATK